MTNLEQEIQHLRDHCNCIIKLATQVGADNYPGFSGPNGINELLRSCDRVFHAADLEKQSRTKGEG